MAGETDYAEGATAKVIEIRKGSSCLETYHIDVSRDYICPYMRTVYEELPCSFECEASDYVREESTGFLFPARFVETSGFPDRQRKEYRLRANSIRFNFSVSERDFSIDIPKGASVHDLLPRTVSIRDMTKHVKKMQESASGKKVFVFPAQERIFVTYRAIDKGTVSLIEGGYDLDRMKWLVRENPSEVHVPSSAGTSGYVRVVLIAAGLVSILAGLFFRSKEAGRTKPADA